MSNSKELKTPKEVAIHYGVDAKYELYRIVDNKWIKRQMPITGKLISAMEDNRARNVRISI